MRWSIKTFSQNSAALNLFISKTCLHWESGTCTDSDWKSKQSIESHNVGCLQKGSSHKAHQMLFMRIESVLWLHYEILF